MVTSGTMVLLKIGEVLIVSEGIDFLESFNAKFLISRRGNLLAVFGLIPDESLVYHLEEKHFLKIEKLEKTTKEMRSHDRFLCDDQTVFLLEAKVTSSIDQKNSKSSQEEGDKALFLQVENKIRSLTPLTEAELSLLMACYTKSALLTLVRAVLSQIFFQDPTEDAILQLFQGNITEISPIDYTIQIIAQIDPLQVFKIAHYLKTAQDILYNQSLVESSPNDYILDVLESTCLSEGVSVIGKDIPLQEVETVVPNNFKQLHLPGIDCLSYVKIVLCLQDFRMFDSLCILGNTLKTCGSDAMRNSCLQNFLTYVLRVHHDFQFCSAGKQVKAEIQSYLNLYPPEVSFTLE